jgi:phosphatidylserine/phosphatidylglycerophosphate/cardiolipin synthase-like enzyme
MKPQKRSSKLKDALRSWLRSRLNPTAASTRRPMSDDMSGPKLIVEPDDGEKPVMDFLNSAQKTVALKQFTFTHPLLLDTVMALHKRGVRVRVMLNDCKGYGRTAERSVLRENEIDWNRGPMEQPQLPGHA